MVEIAAKAIGAWRLTYAKKWSFLALSVLIFAVSVAVLAKADLLPEAPVDEALMALESVNSEPEVAGAVVAVERVETPTRIAVSKLGLDVSVANPETTDIAALDALLLSGSVRYPTSAKLGEDGNVVLFGHSSYLPVVGNKAFKAFNDIQKLAQGDTINVYSDTMVYTYSVRSVAKESAENAAIALSVSGRVLTLATCDSFGKKSDRFVVTAEFVESHLIGA